jgi:hypothetical protein
MVVQDYIDLIIPQHRSQPKFIGWLTAKLNMLHNIEALLAAINPAYDLDSAVGVQLDVLGIILGRPRLLNFQPVYGPALMTDDYYRLTLRAKILSNQWDGTIGGYADMLASIFPDDQVILVDNQDMTADVFYISGMATSYATELFQHGFLFPHPEGIQITFNVSGTTFFGFDFDNSIISGWDVGSWV